MFYLRKKIQNIIKAIKEDSVGRVWHWYFTRRYDNLLVFSTRMRQKQARLEVLGWSKLGHSKNGDVRMEEGAIV